MWLHSQGGFPVAAAAAQAAAAGARAAAEASPLLAGAALLLAAALPAAWRRHRAARTVYLLDFECFRPADHLKVTYQRFMDGSRDAQVRRWAACLSAPAGGNLDSGAGSGGAVQQGC